MKETLDLPSQLDGSLWLYRRSGVPRFMHRHDELELNLVLSGTGTYLLRGRSYRLTEGSLVWLFPEQDHLLVNESPDYSMWIGVFRPHLVQQVCQAIAAHPLCAAAPQESFCRTLAFPQRERLERLFTELSAHYDNSPLYNLGLAFALALAWRLYLEAEQQPYGTWMPPSVQKALRLLRDEETLTLSALAKQCYQSPSHLSRLFHKYVGMSLADYRNQQRLHRFRRLCLAYPHRELLDLALEAGFGSYAQFHRVFVREMGLSPRQYRKNIEEGALEVVQAGRETARK
ncbi:transcriptional regulator containing an amidase domain and an AraC-type DNA-binding HTH domain [Chthonomonas calidirosea]|uniref:Transcriptional regulator containing an amidase domain and an AraC-type DNA-binding HTH domain n=1 Tax=Chthonomonas calidirosea (strain DSM 23976 / ICMP 18418 / T49) TaxID=1303518 RepID=S0EZV3_CHTCT|nr:AraC family transcriptional regulator [Chthonomonas calidirosea]CCW36632.1 Transcriptional regulator containing an amidase domain and an AraC-type DNA-binding HTH domain [Chthonomonas calidirosea T49]CEK16750.1 transcriptional regulator containing an amidase domain and an AraC-type DNA-binding HTH domain [Chthonomonas calidirosea]